MYRSLRPRDWTKMLAAQGRSTHGAKVGLVGQTGRADRQKSDLLWIEKKSTQQKYWHQASRPMSGMNKRGASIVTRIHSRRFATVAAMSLAVQNTVPHAALLQPLAPRTPCDLRLQAQCTGAVRGACAGAVVVRPAAPCTHQQGLIVPSLGSLPRSARPITEAAAPGDTPLP